jgi:hypothetical protein
LFMGAGRVRRDHPPQARRAIRTQGHVPVGRPHARQVRAHHTSAKGGPLAKAARRSKGPGRTDHAPRSHRPRQGALLRQGYRLPPRTNPSPARSASARRGHNLTANSDQPRAQRQATPTRSKACRRCLIRVAARRQVPHADHLRPHDAQRRRARIRHRHHPSHVEAPTQRMAGVGLMLVQ